MMNIPLVMEDGYKQTSIGFLKGIIWYEISKPIDFKRKIIIVKFLFVQQKEQLTLSSTYPHLLLKENVTERVFRSPSWISVQK